MTRRMMCAGPGRGRLNNDRFASRAQAGDIFYSDKGYNGGPGMTAVMNAESVSDAGPDRPSAGWVEPTSPTLRSIPTNTCMLTSITIWAAPILLQAQDRSIRSARQTSAKSLQRRMWRRCLSPVRHEWLQRQLQIEGHRNHREVQAETFDLQNVVPATALSPAIVDLPAAGRNRV